MKKITGPICWLIVLVMPFAFLTCGKASKTGYNAPYGSTVLINGEAEGTLEVTSSGTFCWIVDVRVEGPMVTEVTNEGASDPITQPLSNIQVQIGGVFVRIYTPAEGSTYISGDEDPIERTGDVPFFVKTNSNGFFQFEVCALGPADTGLDEVNAQFWAEIGTAGAQLNITVKAPE